MELAIRATLSPKTPVGAPLSGRRLASRLAFFAAAPTGVFWLSMLVGCYAPGFSAQTPPGGPSDSVDQGGPAIDVGDRTDENGDSEGDVPAPEPPDPEDGGGGDADADADADADDDADSDGDHQPGTDEQGPEDPEPEVELTADERDLFDALNAARAENGLPPVLIDDRLLCAARRHAEDVGGSGACGHVGSDGSWPWDRAQACGYPQDNWTVNEIAAGPGFTSGDEAVWGWSQSPGHWAAIVHTEAAAVGVGVHNTCYIALFDCCVAGG